MGKGKCEFIVWAPFLKKVELKIAASADAGQALSWQYIPMKKDESGYWRVIAEGVFPGALYLYGLDKEKERPDPASYFQPSGVHEPSQVIDHEHFTWEDKPRNEIDISRMIMYELHTGTFTEQGTFDAIIPRLDELKDFGINAIEIMPVAQFPGERNWGYDGVYLYAVHNSYGGPDGLKRLVNECHKKEIAVVLDVVYSHLGPEGNYLWDYGPYFTDKYKTPWGSAINFDSAYCDEVRNFLIENAQYWFKNYHVDALRLDAIHAIFDMSAKHFLEELAERVEEFSREEERKFYLIAESNLNDARVIRPKDVGGYGVDSQWYDDLHHSLHTLLTGEDEGYYMDFGQVDHLVKCLKEGFVYSGQFSKFRKRRHGNSSKDRPGKQFVVFSQNHDQIGNRMLGERLSSLVPFEGLKLAAAVVILSPYVPLLFMGEEYGEEAPFLYFVSHSDPFLIEAVRKGRREEFTAFNWEEEPPDLQSEKTFLESKIDWERRKRGKHKILLDFHKKLIELRKETPALSGLDKKNMNVWGIEKERVVFMTRWDHGNKGGVFSIFNFNQGPLNLENPFPQGKWKKVLDSSDKIWGGPGTSLSNEMISEGNGLRLRPGSDNNVVVIKGLSTAVYLMSE